MADEFPVGGGEMGMLIRAFDWSGNELGPIETWGPALRTATNIVLQSPVPLVMLWGPNGIMIYNDAYSGFAGKRHPSLLGSRVLEGWAEVADFNARVLEVGLAGGTLSFKDQELTLHRNNVPEQVWMDLNYGPVLGEDNKPAGVLSFVVETTGRVRAEALVKASEQRFRALVNATSDIIYRMSPDWTEMRQLDGRGILADTDGPSIAWLDEYLLPEDRPEIRAAIDKAVRDKAPFQLEHRVRQQDGSVGWLSSRAVPLLNGTGDIIEWFGAGSDVTPRKKAEERFRTIVETIEAAFAIVQVKFDADDRPIDYRFVEANPAFERQSGVNLRGKWVTEFAPDLEQFWFETYGRVAATGEPATFESYAKAFGRWFDVRAVRVGDPAERQIAILFNDTTERRTAEERLRVSEALARENAQRVQLALAAGAIVGTWHWDLPSDRFTVDEAFARAFGLDPSLGREGLSLAQVVATVHPDDREALAAAINEVIARGGAYAHQYRVRRLTGEYHWIEANGRVDHGPDGTPLSFPGVLIDVAERRALVEDRDRALRELRELNETLEQRVTERSAKLLEAEEALRQSQKMEAVGQLTGGLAHDFNNLLAGISGSLELMNTRIGQGRIADVDKYMAAAQGAARRAAALTHRLLAFSRRQTLDPKATDVNKLVTDMLDLIRRTVGPSVAVEFVGRANLWSVLVDPSQLENALLNLCINARDAMPNGGRITIETDHRQLEGHQAEIRDVPEGSYLVLSVSDDGHGMAPEVLARAFEPFFTTKPTGQGTGLGLSMIYGFAKQSGGQVRIHSLVGMGTTIAIYLPRHGGATASDERLPEPVPMPVVESGETVLIVDDEATVRMLVMDVLLDLGYTAIEAADGAGGLNVLQSNARIDLLVTDVGLPGGMNGRQLADAARVSRPDLKVLFITGFAENALVKNGQLETGMAVLTKPFAMDTLAARVRELIAT